MLFHLLQEMGSCFRRAAVCPSCLSSYMQKRVLHSPGLSVPNLFRPFPPLEPNETLEIASPRPPPLLLPVRSRSPSPLRLTSLSVCLCPKRRRLAAVATCRHVSPRVAACPSPIPIADCREGERERGRERRREREKKKKTASPTLAVRVLERSTIALPPSALCIAMKFLVMT